ncbi:putative NADPH-ferrihemoprotein reductase [Rosellinia necatrix]|uniref:Putative NADPH-ferrihemoprotein reductase n=1 Tax=Rosellinia necatrix TaxID=77044 RepID=A0A1W2TS89_ROSNE|nr:putative NADPH-ferrihemoprotein reductase [Rosellinia necatrix]
MAALMRPETVSAVLQYSKPQSALDIASLAALGVVSATYLLKGTPWNRPDPYHNVWYERPQFKDGFQSNRPKATRNIAEKLEQTNQRVVIFWGSQSGTAEVFAQKLARECRLRYGLDSIAVDLSDYDPETISQIPEAKLTIFILSTFGEGDPSDNTAGFWEWLHKDPSKVSLPNLQYAAFGLGNSNYKYYNRVVDVVVSSLDKAGAKSFLPLGRADDANGETEEDFLAWKADLFATLEKNLGCHEREIIYTPTLAVREDPSLEPIDLHHGAPLERPSGSQGKSIKTSTVQTFAVTQARELYTTPNRNCVHLELNRGDHSEVRYKTGDYLAVYPIAPDDEVDALLNAMGWKEKASTPLLVDPLEEGTALRIPSPTSANAIFRYYLEVCAPVARDTVKDLAQFAPTPEAKALLLALGKSKAAYNAFTSRNYVTLGRLLALTAPGAVWKDLPLSYLLEIIPATQPRGQRCDE